MFCLKCGANLPADLVGSVCPACLETQKRADAVTKRLLLCGGVLGAIVAGVVIYSFSFPASDPSTQAQPSAAANPLTPSGSAPPAAAAPPAASQWNYGSILVDAGTKTLRYACLESNEAVILQSPYSNTYAQLCFRSDKTILFRLEGDGQLLSGDEHGARISIAGTPARSFSLGQAADYDTRVAFISPESPLFAAAKAGKSISIEATYYEAGVQTVTFSPPAPLDLK